MTGLTCHRPNISIHSAVLRRNDADETRGVRWCKRHIGCVNHCWEQWELLHLCKSGGNRLFPQNHYIKWFPLDLHMPQTTFALSRFCKSGVNHLSPNGFAWVSGAGWFRGASNNICSKPPLQIRSKPFVSQWFCVGHKTIGKHKVSAGCF